MRERGEKGGGRKGFGGLFFWIVLLLFRLVRRLFIILIILVIMILLLLFVILLCNFRDFHMFISSLLFLSLVLFIFFCFQGHFSFFEFPSDSFQISNFGKKITEKEREKEKEKEREEGEEGEERRRKEGVVIKKRGKENYGPFVESILNYEFKNLKVFFSLLLFLSFLFPSFFFFLTPFNLPSFILFLLFLLFLPLSSSPFQRLSP